MKMALMLAAAGATGRFPGGPRDLLERGAKMLAGSPEFAKIGDTVRGELMNAAKEAAVTAASQRIDSLSNRLQSGGQVVTGTVSDVTDTVDDVAKVGRLGRKKRTRSRVDEEANADEQSDNDYADEADDYEEPDEDEVDEEPAPPKRPAARRRSTSGSSRPAGKSVSTKRDEDDIDDEEAPVRKRRTRAKATTDSPPVRRARR